MNGSEPLAPLRRALLAFYDATRRELPWRGTDDPYRVWVSEIMLQQTRVETVIPYFERWLERFPTLSSLAAADVDDVLPIWKGLGYYSRARNLHRAAQAVRDRHGGVIPRDAVALRDLPGVGRYTAGAVASIAFGVPEPVVDGNVRRVLSRLFDLEAPDESELWAAAEALLDRRRPGDFNQALMELGATVCTPRAPSCDACPLAFRCAALERGTVALRPPPRKRGPVPHLHYLSLVVWTDEGRTVLVQRPDEGLLARMWEFPAREMVAVPERCRSALPAVDHQFSHLKATYHPLLVQLERPEVDPRAVLAGLGHSAASARWVTLAEAEGLALPVAQQKIARSVAEHMRNR
ncbi:MAG: A/G-specific adenine glycosylase [Gemmatimonadota bacterium]